MSRIAPLTFEDLDAELQPLMSAGNKMMGFMPNDGLIMARKPAVDNQRTLADDNRHRKKITMTNNHLDLTQHKK